MPGPDLDDHVPLLERMRRPPQLGQKPLFLHEKGTRRSKAPSSHRMRAKPAERSTCEEVPELTLADSLLQSRHDRLRAERAPTLRRDRREELVDDGGERQPYPELLGGGAR